MTEHIQECACDICKLPDQLRAIANWHDSENPSRLALGAVASCALNHIQILEERVQRLEEAVRFCRDMALEEYDYQKQNVGAELVLRHIIRKARESLPND